MTRLHACATLLVATGVLALAQSPLSDVPDKVAVKWVDDTFKKMTLDDKVGQLIVTTLNSQYLPGDTDEFERLVKKVVELRVGGVHVFGASEPAPNVLLNNHYGTVILGQAFAAASTLNRLQKQSALPLLNTADFEAGAGFRIHGSTAFPRAMAIGAAGDEQLAYESGRITALEARAMGVHVNFAPVVDVNNNPRNPVINTRAFGESPEAVGRLASAYIRGLHVGGMLATLKHFPGHGDTDVDSHIGLPIISQPRERLDSVELPPFRAGITTGADAIMTAHIQLPALDGGAFSPASLSQPIVTGLLRGELKFDGLVYTDAMTMDAVARKMPAGEAATLAIKAGSDFVLQSPDEPAAVAAIKAAIASGEIPMAQIDASVRRILRAKARVGLHKTKTVSLDDLPSVVGGRTHARVAQSASQKSITLVKDDRNQVPLRVPRESSVLYLSILDYTSGWRIAAPSRTFIPELRRRWPTLTSIELSDRTPITELELVRASAPRYDAIVASVFVRASSGSGRMDLAPPLAKLLNDIGRATGGTPRPFIVTCFGNPYTAMALTDVPAVLLTYDFYDLAESSAARALVGDAPISGRLPIALPGLFEVGHGLVR